MCAHDPPPAPLRHGAALEHGDAHTQDHVRWNRRDFLVGAGMAASATVLLGQTPVKALPSSPLLHALANVENDRVLVIVQLSGGNDGLNTVIPIENDLYYNARPTLAIAKNEALRLSDTVGLHPRLAPLEPMWHDSELSVLHAVGYPDPSLSHFRATDIWTTASAADDVMNTGWAGRWLEADHPDFAENPTAYPLAVQLGGSLSLMFQGTSTGMGMTLLEPELLERILESGTLYDEQNVPATAYGDEMAFVRSIANDSFHYAEAIQSAARGQSNAVSYPPNSGLANNLAQVARLIKGRLGAKIYLVSLGGFDTHANQAGQHGALMEQLSGAVSAFTADLAADGMAEDALVMTFSEFGRRVQQNGSNGTDHGTAAPLFLFGPTTTGGFFGNAPDLDDVDETGNLKHAIDFREVYATVLTDWFGVPSDTVSGVLGGEFGTLGFVAEPAAPTPLTPPPAPATFTLDPNFPNPFHHQTTLPFTLGQPGHVHLAIYDIQGRLVRVLLDGLHPAGHHRVTLDGSHLPAGLYLARLTQHGATRSLKLTVVR